MYRSLTNQSIASAHGAEILCSFLHKVHACHSSPASFPSLSKAILKLSTKYEGLEEEEHLRPASQDSEVEEEDAMLESTTETFGMTGARSVNSEEMFLGLIDRVNSPLGQVWLDGVSVGISDLECCISETDNTGSDAGSYHVVYRLPVLHHHIYNINADRDLSFPLAQLDRRFDRECEKGYIAARDIR